MHIHITFKPVALICQKTTLKISICTLLIWQMVKQRNKESRQTKTKQRLGCSSKTASLWSCTAEHFERRGTNMSTKFELKWQILQVALTHSQREALLCMAFFVIFMYGVFLYVIDLNTLEMTKLGTTTTEIKAAEDGLVHTFMKAHEHVG